MEEQLNSTEERDDFQIRELKYYFEILYEKKENYSTIQHAVNILKLTQGEIMT